MISMQQRFGLVLSLGLAFLSAQLRRFLMTIR
jgi:hypothetical protein